MRSNNNNNGKFVSVSGQSSSTNTHQRVGAGIHLRTSPERQRNLQRYASYLTGDDDVRVNLSESAQTASINGMDGDKSPLITIPTFSNENTPSVENPYPTVDDELFFSMLQYAEIVHEAGHHKYTDQPTVTQEMKKLQKHVQSYPHQLQGFLLSLGRDLWNAAEDGAIETAIRKEKNRRSMRDRLKTKNETFIAQSVKSYPLEKTQNVEFDMALFVASLDKGKYKTGGLSRLLDEDDDSWQFNSEFDEELFMQILPELKKTFAEAKLTPNAIERTHLIFEFVRETVDTIGEALEEEGDDSQPSEESQQDREEMQQHFTDDTENDSGEAQDPDATGLQILVESVEEDEDEGEADSDVDDEQNTSGQPQSKQEQEQDQSQEDGDSDADSSSMTGGQGGTQDEDVPCPSCGSTDTDRLVQVVDGMVAARVNAPFNIKAEWVDSITFVKNNEVCGFRIATTGNVPRENIEEKGYKVVDVKSGVEVLEPRNRYDDSEKVNGFECDSCGHQWVPVVGGDL